ncbi:ABC transporter ATP-binding protein [Streptomyces albiaxialis]|uniref:ABC transporter ATP-binding protein n=1 Tax=Streptomyces albiaxialis TaxID=329523 RepID=A0ABP5IGP9_9ACTN
MTTTVRGGARPEEDPEEREGPKDPQAPKDPQGPSKGDQDPSKGDTGSAGPGRAAASPEGPPGDDAFDKDVLPTPKGASRRLLGSLLRPHRRRVTGAAVLLLVQQAAVQAGPLLVAYAIDSALPALRGERDYGPLIAVAVGYLVCAVASGGFQHAFILAAARINQRVLLELRGRIYRHAQALDVDFHDRYTSGRLISRSTTDVEALRELLDEGLQELLAVILSVVYILVTLVWLDPGLGGAALLSFVPLALLVRNFRRRSLRVYRGKSTAIAAVIVKFAETMNGIRPVQSFRRERANDTAFEQLNGRHLKANGDAILEMARYVVLSRLVANTAVAAIVVWGAYRVASGGLALGVLAAAALYLRRLYDPIDRLGMFLNSWQSAAASLEKIAGLLARRPAVPEPERPRELPPRDPGLPGREVVFERVRFAYRTGGEVLPEFSLTLPAGQTVAVVGATGAGKSTLAKLLARFYDPSPSSPTSSEQGRPQPSSPTSSEQGRPQPSSPTSSEQGRPQPSSPTSSEQGRPQGGTVRLDGVDLRELDVSALRRGVVMVTQEAFLFSGTVAENIALGRPDAGREEIEQAAKSIGAHDFIAGLPDGYDTDVRKRGGRISAGQRQLVSFARALLADPSVLILDEATSSLDIPGERAVQRAMETVLRGRTAVVIAHRLSTVAVADRVLVMDGGRIVEDGPPDRLIAGTGRFAELHSAWRDSLT